MKFRNQWTLHVLDHVKGKVLRACAREYDALVPSRINSSFRAAVIGIGVKLHEHLVNAYPSLPSLRSQDLSMEWHRPAFAIERFERSLILCANLRPTCKKALPRRLSRDATASPGEG